jgi:hypothetical protein
MSDSGDDIVGSRMTFSLHLCYFGIFQGLPLMEMDGYDRFLDAHARHDPPIETLQDFEDHYLDVVAMFEGNDFAREYADASTANPARFPAVPARVSSAGIAGGLRAMKATITFLGSEVVTAMVEHLWREYGELVETETDAVGDAHRDPEVVFGLIGGYLGLARGGGTRRKHICHTRRPERVATVYRLLGRLLGQV